MVRNLLLNPRVFFAAAIWGGSESVFLGDGFLLWSTMTLYCGIKFGLLAESPIRIIVALLFEAERGDGIFIAMRRSKMTD